MLPKEYLEEVNKVNDEQGIKKESRNGIRNIIQELMLEKQAKGEDVTFYKFFFKLEQNVMEKRQNRKNKIQQFNELLKKEN